MTKCKNCQTEGKLEEIKDYQYQEDDDSPIEVINVLKCLICDCLHWSNETHDYFEFLAGSKESNTDNVGKWATNHNKKELV